MKYLIKILFLFFYNTLLLAQHYVCEMPYVIENGIVKSRRVNVAFNTQVIPTPAGIDTINTAIFKIQDTNFNKLLNQLSFKYGNPKIIKRFSNSVWGDTLVVNKRNGIISRKPDNSPKF